MSHLFPATTSRLLSDLAKYWSVPVGSTTFKSKLVSLRERFPERVFDIVEERIFRALTQDTVITDWLFNGLTDAAVIERLESREKIISLLESGQFKSAERIYLTCASWWLAKDYAEFVASKKRQRVLKVEAAVTAARQLEESRIADEADRQRRHFEAGRKMELARQLEAAEALRRQESDRESALHAEKVINDRREFISTLRNMMLERQLVDASELKRLIGYRKPPYLVHFTRIENLPSILDCGIIPKINLESGGVCNDDKRFDGFLEATSFSVSFPNYQMFYRYRCENPDSNWAIVSISTETLLEIPALFYPSNAANSSFRNESKTTLVTRMGSTGFSSLFIDEPFGVREERQLPLYYPTDPQSEVLMFGKVEPKRFVAIALMRRDPIIEELVRIKLPSIRRSIGGSLFKPRSDFRFWQRQVHADLGDFQN